MATRTDYLRVAASQVGIAEDPPNSNHTPYGVWFGADRVPWCCIFQSWVAARVGVAFRFALVMAAVGWAKKNGRWRPDPQPGFLCCKSYGNGSGHIGAVELVYPDGSVGSIEGNTGAGNDRDGGHVAKVRRSRSFWNAGYIDLGLTDDAPPPPPPPVVPQPPARRAYPGVPLRRGSVGADVRWVQLHVGATVDGDFGRLTDQAVRHFQKDHGLTSDGIVGPKTWAALA